MGILFFDGFETGKASPFWLEPPEYVDASSAGFSGSYVGRPLNSTTAIRLPTTKTELYISLKYKFANVATGVLGFKDSGGTSIGCVTIAGSSPNWYLEVRRGNNSGTILADGSANPWDHWNTSLIEIHYKPLNSGGSFQVKRDGILIINYSGDTTAGLEEVYEVWFAGFGSNNYQIDDVVIADDNWIGNVRVQKLQISGAGTTGQWDASTGNPYQCVDEIPYSDTDFISTNVSDESATFACADMTGTIASVLAVAVYARIGYEGTPTPTKQKIAVRSGGSEYYGDDVSPSLSFVTYGKMWLLNPADSQAWEEADVNAIEIGVRSVA